MAVVNPAGVLDCAFVVVLRNRQCNVPYRVTAVTLVTLFRGREALTTRLAAGEQDHVTNAEAVMSGRTVRGG